MSENKRNFAWGYGIIVGALVLISLLPEKVSYVTYPDGISFDWWQPIPFIIITHSTAIWLYKIASFYPRHTRIESAITFVSYISAALWALVFYARLDWLWHETFQSLVVHTLIRTGGITFGLVLVLVGINYLTQSSSIRDISLLSGLIFSVSGVIGFLIVCGSGTSVLPNFTIFDIPMIQVVAIPASVIGLAITPGGRKSIDSQ